MWSWYAASLAFVFCVRLLLWQRKKTTSPTIATRPTAPPTAPPITAPDAEEELEPGGEVTALTLPDGLDSADERVDGLPLTVTERLGVAEGMTDETNMFSAPKYAIWAGLSIIAGSSLPAGHVALFAHGLALQQPQNDGLAKQVQKSVLPPQVPPGD
jgi:hypothetical protein